MSTLGLSQRLVHFQLRQPQKPQPDTPAPKAVTNIRYQYNVNPDGIVSGRNIIYDRTNLDGTIDQVCRIWEVYAKGLICYGQFQGGPHIQPVPLAEEAVIRTYIRNCEIKLKYYKPANVNVWRCGAFLWEKRLSPLPPPVPPPPTLNQQVATLTAQVNKLNQANAALAATNQQQSAELAQIKKDLAKMTQLLSQLTD